MPSSPLTVTAGKSWVAGDAVTPDNLNATAKPVVVIPDGAIDADQLSASGKNALKGGANLFNNGDFSRWTRSTSTSAAAGTRTFAADWWYALAAGAAVTYERVAAGPSNNRTYYAAKITGASSVTTVDIGQRRGLRLGTTLRGGLSVSVQIYNGTGATFTPQLVVYTADAADNFGAVTQRLAENFDTAAANGAWTECTVTISAATMAALTNINNGAEVAIRIPSGSMTSGKYVQIAQADMRAGTTVGVFSVDRENDQEEASAATSDEEEYIRNGDFARWISASVAATTTATDTIGPEDWYVNSAGAGVTLARETTVLPGSETIFSLKITGATSVNAVDLVQYVEAVQAAALSGGDISIGIDIYNATAADFAPDIVIATCNTRDDFSATTTRHTTTATTCAVGGWTRITAETDASVLTNFSNGFRLIIRIPSGSLDANTKDVYIGQAALRPGAGETAYVARPVMRSQMAGPGAAGIIITKTGSNTLSCATGRIVLVADDGRSVALRSIASTTLTITSTGANGIDTGTVANTTWYAIHAICTNDGQTAGFLASLSDTAPTLPAGYKYWCHIGWAYYKTAQWRRFTQRGNVVNSEQVTLKNGTFAATTVATLTVSAADVPPSGVASYFGTAGVTTANGCAVTISGESGAINGNQHVVCDNVGTAVNGVYAGGNWEVVPDTLGSVYAKPASTTPTYLILLNGYRLAL